MCPEKNMQTYLFFFVLFSLKYIVTFLIIPSFFHSIAIDDWESKTYGKIEIQF